MNNEAQWKDVDAASAREQTTKIFARNINQFAPVLKDMPLLKALFSEPIAETQFSARENTMNHSYQVQMEDPTKLFNITEAMGPSANGDVCTFWVQDKFQNLVVTGGSNGYDQIHVSIAKFGAQDTDKPIELTVKIPVI